MYIVDFGGFRYIWVFDVNSDGMFSNGKLFVIIDFGGFDGICCDVDE